ncbi:hypothetical protein K438DRAFT_1965483 [Mycena galopus ATCC 62051]|nr:hypothetical protein K438DRAFT_1965483 [Mycena galopus ATCC 62051]
MGDSKKKKEKAGHEAKKHRTNKQTEPHGGPAASTKSLTEMILANKENVEGLGGTVASGRPKRATKSTYDRNMPEDEPENQQAPQGKKKRKIPTNEGPLPPDPPLRSKPSAHQETDASDDDEIPLKKRKIEQGNNKPKPVSEQDDISHKVSFLALCLLVDGLHRVEGLDRVQGLRLLVDGLRLLVDSLRPLVDNPDCVQGLLPVSMFDSPIKAPPSIFGAKPAQEDVNMSDASTGNREKDEAADSDQDGQDLCDDYDANQDDLDFSDVPRVKPAKKKVLLLESSEEEMEDDLEEDHQHKRDGDKDRGRGNDGRGDNTNDRGRGDNDHERVDNDRRRGDKDRGRSDNDRSDKDRGRGDNNRGRGDNDRGRSNNTNDRGRGDNDHERVDKDRGRGDKDRGRSDNDRGDNDRGCGDNDRGCGDKDRGCGDKDRGRSDKDRGGRSDKDRGGHSDKDRGGRSDKDKDRGHDKERPSNGRGDTDGHRSGSRGGVKGHGGGGQPRKGSDKAQSQYQSDRRAQEGKVVISSTPLSTNCSSAEQGSYDVSNKHHSGNRAKKAPSVHRLIKTKKKQDGRDSGEDVGEADDEGDEYSDGEGANTSKDRKRRSAREGGPSPTQEGFYPSEWLKIVGQTKDSLFLHLLDKDLFPDKETGLKHIRAELCEEIMYREKEIQEALYWEDHSDDMVELIWEFVATFRSRCYRRSRDVVNTLFSSEISPKFEEADDPERGFSQEEYRMKTEEKVAALLNKSSFLHVVDEDGNKIDFGSRGIWLLGETVLTMGKRPLLEIYPDTFREWSTNFIVALSVLLPCALSEYETGHYVKKEFTRSANKPYYIKGLSLCEKLQNRPVRWQRSLKQSNTWALRLRLRHPTKTEVQAANDNEMDLGTDSEREDKREAQG